MDMDAINHLNKLSEEMLVLLQQRLDTVSLSQPLKAAVEYAVMQGGKRIRPKLVYVAALACGGVSYNTHLAAMAVELIHCYSLIHDDLPCMDDDALRRGKPTCHIQYGEATALLAGDYLQSLAFMLLGQEDINNTLKASLRIQQIHVLAKHAAAMVNGQNLDLEAENKHISESDLRKIHQDKTGALIIAAVSLGALSAGVTLEDPKMAALHDFAQNLGLAYQVQDDILDVMSDTQTLGKPAGSDEKLHKSTYPALLGLKEAQQLASDLLYRALQALELLPAEALKALTAQLLVRRY